jgi:hypothetical protein
MALDDVAPFGVCIDFYCFGACGGNQDACLTCQTTQCPNEYVQAFSTPDGYLLVDCAGACNDVTCIDGCENTYPKAKPAFDTFLACSHTKCSGICP